MRKLLIVSIIGLRGTLGWAVPNGPVVVELFESQGCSSCPPSERTIESLANEFGSSVILLVFHVDYWDHLGWKDTFSDKRYTDRQTVYGRAFGRESIYTPEMVIQGEEGFNGSDLGQARKVIRARLGEPRPVLEMSLIPQTNKVRLSVRLASERAKSAKSVEAIIYENADPVKVLRGENTGETMSGRFAVRDIRAITIKSGQGQANLTLGPGWNAERLGVAVLVRGANTSILSAQSAPWPHP